MNTDPLIMLYRALEEKQNPEAMRFIESSKENQPSQLFLQLAQIILLDNTPQSIILSSIVLMSTILKPTIVRPLNVLANQYSSYDIQSQDVIKRANFRCLMASDAVVRAHAARCIGFIAKIERSQRKWQDVFDQLDRLAHTGEYGEWSPIGAISSMKEILSEVKLRPRHQIYQTASRVVLTSCLEALSKPIDPELKIEAVKCLKVAVSIFIPAIQDTQFHQTLMQLIIQHIPIDNDLFHQNLLSLLTKFIIKIYGLLNQELIGQIFTALLPDLISNNEHRQYHVIRLCQKFAKFERSVFSEGRECFTELLEQNLDIVLLKIIANGDFSDLNEAESTWITPHAALNCLFEFGRIFPERLFQDCVEFYQEHMQNESPGIKLSALCAAQVIASIDTEYSTSFISQQLNLVIQLCACAEPLVRTSAFSVLQTVISKKPNILCTPEHFTTILQIVAFGLNSDLATARHALLVFNELCNRFDNSNDTFLSDSYDSIMLILTAASKRQDAICDQFIEEISNTIFLYIRHVHSNKEPQLVELLKMFIGQLTQEAQDPEERQKTCNIYIIIGIVQALGDKIAPFGSQLLNVLFQVMQDFRSASSVIIAIAQVVFYLRDGAKSFLLQMMEVIQSAQTSISPDLITASSMLIGNIVLSIGQDSFPLVPRMFEFICNNLWNVATLSSTVPPLLFAISDMIKGIAVVNVENARQLVTPTMDICIGYVKNLEFLVVSDFDAANLIADALMNVFIVIINAFPTETQFISDNLKPVFIQVPIFVWEHQMISHRTVEIFLNLMHRLILHVGRKFNIELHHKSLQEFLDYANSDDSPFQDLVQMARIVKKFLSDI